MSRADVAEPLEMLFQRHHGMMLRAAYRICGNVADAEDVLQTVFLRLARTENAAGMKSAEGYLYRATVNAALDVVRSKRETQYVSLDDETQPVADVNTAAAGAGLEERDLRRVLREALAELNPRAAAMFVLRHLEDQSNAEIARIMQTSTAVVAVTLFRARRQLQKRFRDLQRGK